MFEAFPKISRLSRPIVITEKLDGSNGQLYILSHKDYVDMNGFQPHNDSQAICNGEFVMLVGSRKRWLDATKQGDHFGFFKWAEQNFDDLTQTLGFGRHYGEWWGKGIQRGYGLEEKRFSLFNTHRWDASTKPECCHVVPVLLTTDAFSTGAIDHELSRLSCFGSRAMPGFMNPEGVVVYHAHGNSLFKKTFKGDLIYDPNKQRSDG